jgi:hypothetical protein
MDTKVDNFSEMSSILSVKSSLGTDPVLRRMELRSSCGKYC